MISTNTYFGTYGGLHTIVAANQAKKKFKAGETKLTRADPRWDKFPARVFLFAEKVDKYKDFIRQVGEEDNQNLRYVCSLCAIFARRKRHFWTNTKSFEAYFLRNMREKMRMGN